MWRCLTVIALCCSLIACGGGSSSSNPPPPAPPQSISGIWTGTATSSAFGLSSDLIGIISESNEVFFITSQASQEHGTLSVSGSHVSGSLIAFAPIGQVFPDGSSAATISVTGTVHTKSTLSGSFSGGGDTGTFSLTYNPLYDRSSSFSLVTGTWLTSDGIIISVNQSGQFNGSDPSGCLLNGQISIINSSFNAYRVNVTVSNCGIVDGDYDGLATLVDNLAANDTLDVGVSNASISIVAEFTLQ